MIFTSTEAMPFFAFSIVNYAFFGTPNSRPAIRVIVSLVLRGAQGIESNLFSALKMPGW